MRNNEHTDIHNEQHQYKVGEGKNIIPTALTIIASLLLISCSDSEPTPSQIEHDVTNTAPTTAHNTPDIDYSVLLTSHAWSIDRALHSTGSIVCDMADRGAFCIFSSDSVKIYTQEICYDVASNTGATNIALHSSYAYTLQSGAITIGARRLRLAATESGITMYDDEWQIYLGAD